MFTLFYLSFTMFSCVTRIFLKNRHFYVCNPETSPLKILDYSEYGIFEIKNVRSSDMSMEAAYANVLGIAENNWNIR